MSKQNIIIDIYKNIVKYDNGVKHYDSKLRMGENHFDLSKTHSKLMLNEKLDLKFRVLDNNSSKYIKFKPNMNTNLIRYFNLPEEKQQDCFHFGLMVHNSCDIKKTYITSSHIKPGDFIGLYKEKNLIHSLIHIKDNICISKYGKLGIYITNLYDTMRIYNTDSGNVIKFESKKVELCDNVDNIDRMFDRFILNKN